MAILKYKRSVYYDQSNNSDDVKVGGRCFVYVVLFYTYILAYKQLFSESLYIDYKGLKRVFSEFKPKNKIDDLQEKYEMKVFSKALGRVTNSPNAQLIFDKEIAMLAENTVLDSSQNLLHECKKIRDHILHFKKPIFFALSLFDKQLINNRWFFHIVGMYLLSPKELHFFDADSGVYVISLPEKVNLFDLRQTLFELLFKVPLSKNFDPYSASMEYRLITSQQTQLTEQQQQILHIITDDLVYSLYDEFPSSERRTIEEKSSEVKDFLARLEFTINIQREVFSKEIMPNEFLRNRFRYFQPQYENEEKGVIAIEMKTFSCTN